VWVGARHRGVPEISCDSRKVAIQGAVAALAGVRRVRVDVPARQVRVDSDEAVTRRRALVAAIEGAGHAAPDDGLTP
jgi:copper chaperone CopZ